MPGSSSLAWELVRGQRKATAQLLEEDNSGLRLVESEIVRLAALNRAMHIWSLASDSKTRQVRGLVFNTLTMNAKPASINERNIIDATKELLATTESSGIDESIADLSSDDFIELIAHVHSIGSFHLPEGHTPNVPQRVLGAYYTPQEVSDFIADLALRPLIRSLAKKNGFDGFRDHLKLVDPACGPGVFLLSAIRACSKQFPETPIHEVARTMRPNLYGVDLDESALEIADISLSIICREQIGDSGNTSLGRTLKVGNSLISLNGWNGSKNHEVYFENPGSRNSFEWRSQFPEVLDGEGGGFDALLMNPPYERLKPNFAEFMRERLLSGSRKVHSDEFEHYKARLLEDLGYYRNSEEYTLANKHTLDTYRLFIERSLNLVRHGGSIGFIVPSTVLGDLSAERIRQAILLENSVKAVNDFPEGNHLFANVTQSVSIIALERGGSTQKLRASFGLRTVNDARKNKGYIIEVDKIPASLRKSMVVPRLEKKGWHVLRKLHANPTLDSIQWLSNRRGEFDLTLHKRFISTSGARLLRGSHITRYTLRSGRRRPDEFVDIDAFHASIGSSSRIEDSHQDRIACQQISNRNQRWRLKFAPVKPGVALANSCNYVVLSKDSDPQLLDYLLGVLNSEIMNWRFDISSTNNHVSNRELSGLPLPPFEESVASNLVKRIGTLARDCSRSGRTYDADLEALVFSLYGIEPQNAKRILFSRGASEDEIVSVLDVLQGLMSR